MTGRLFIILILLSCNVMAQDNFTGTWETTHQTPGSGMPVVATLQVARGEKSILYPAELTLQCGTFHGVYQLLLVRKNIRQAAISKTKHPIKETPFSIGNRTISLNGTFDLSIDYKDGSQYLSPNRIFFKKPFYKPDELKQSAGDDAAVIRSLVDFFESASFKLKKTNSLPWESIDASSILDTKLSAAYFGIKDSVFLKRKDGYILFNKNKKIDNDTVSIALNGKMIADQVPLNKKREAEEFLLDTGMNVLVVFADNFGKNPPNHGKFQVDFSYKQWMIDFMQAEDQGSTFIVSRLFYEQDKASITRFASFFDSTPTEKILNRESKLLGNLVATSHEITLALWDDAVEDGDSISLNINGNWITRGFPVLKKPQFIKVSLKPGPNSITFVADNLGSIPPNTSVLEIIDGNKRKAFMIDTDMDKNNLVRIFYDYKPDE